MLSHVNRLYSEMDTKRPELGRHCLAVAELLKTIASSAKTEMGETELVAAAMLHDYGKIFWPPELFVRDRRYLSISDIGIILDHAKVGRRLVEEKWPECPEAVLRLIERHHNPEEWFPAQLLAACDIFVACNEVRHYRQGALPYKTTIREMLNNVSERVVTMVIGLAIQAIGPADRSNGR